MTITQDQKRVIDSVLCIFETGKLPTAAAYSTCSILTDGAGISYGKHQSTDKGGSLDKIVELYIDRSGKYAAELKPFVANLSSNETSKVDPKNPPQWAKQLIEILKNAGSDSIMQQCQDEVFDSSYWMPAVGHAKDLNLQTALGHLMIYDTCIHSGPGCVAVIRSKFAALPPSKGGDEKAFIAAYIAARKNWLLSNSNPLVQRTVYRMDSLNELVKAGNWDLKTPVIVRGVKIP